MERRICPICLAPLDPQQVYWRNPAGENAPGPPARRSALQRLKKALGREPDTTAQEWADWYARGFRAYCPQHQGELPEDIFSRELVVIGLVGESGSSKTHYMAALLHLLSSGVLAQHKLIAQFDATTVVRYHNDYHRRLFIDHEVIPASRPLRWFDQSAGHREVRLPMTVVLRNWETGRAVNVCLFDAAGEQLMTRELQATWARHLSIADGLLFFVDPAILPGVGVGNGAMQSLHVTESVIAVTADLVRRARSLSPDDDLAEVPAALLLAKADLLVDRPDFPAQVLESLDLTDEAPYRIANRILQDSELVEQYLVSHGGQNLVMSAAYNFHGITFHAVSATGHAAENGVYPALEPRRCVEPFLLLLSKIGIIQVERADA